MKYGHLALGLTAAHQYMMCNCDVMSPQEVPCKVFVVWHLTNDESCA